ncbi:hypothetical protein CAPTEDRAFT_186109 [Capitella teleta]|uniref:Uncharacterized protein n=1 Tax=Capitella teleta TaxID=283909 RepID=R7TPP1_CAPTE|nr:hypothetical protein CAPTEDRAFT_186109 [Capitella teleta]|eukprot:ELT95537.1 hypothetical protein CAPTEDRAFT_186109 [Capitella teleta]
MRSGRSKEEQVHYKRLKADAHKLNLDAKKDGSQVSFSVRDNGKIWKYVKDDSVCNDVDVEIQLLCRNVRFLRSLERSNNRVVRCCFQLVQNGSRSTVSRSFSKLCDVTQKSRHHIVESVCHPTALFKIGKDHEEMAGLCYRKDRAETQPNVRGGGILFGIDNRLPSKRRPDLECNCEVLVCEINGRSASRSKIALILVYRSPSSDVVSFINMLNETLIKQILLHVEFIRMTESHALDHLNTYPSNANGSFLDLVFANDSALVNDVVSSFVPVFRVRESHDPACQNSVKRDECEISFTRTAEGSAHSTAPIVNNRRITFFASPQSEIDSEKKARFKPLKFDALHILPLSYRREVADLMFVFKYLKGFINVDFADEMDLKDLLGATNASLANGSNAKAVYAEYLDRRPTIAVPYLIIISIAIVMGTIGNVLIIGAVLVSKLFICYKVKHYIKNEETKIKR